jgi:predicted RNase H-like HicB family nuclease
MPEAANNLMIMSAPMGMILTRRGDHAMTKEFGVVIERDEDGFFVASVPALRGCHTQAKSLDVLMRRIREAIELCVQVVPVHRGESIGRGLLA